MVCDRVKPHVVQMPFPPFVKQKEHAGKEVETILREICFRLVQTPAALLSVHLPSSAGGAAPEEVCLEPLLLVCFYFLVLSVQIF